MNETKVNQCLLALPYAECGYPFGPDVQVYKVKGKVFALLAQGKISEHYWLNLKCDPDEAAALRDIFPSVTPGYHMDKKHWNTVILDNTVPAGEIERMIENSYWLVVAKLPKKIRTLIELPNAGNESVK